MKINKTHTALKTNPRLLSGLVAIAAGVFALGTSTIAHAEDMSGYGSTINAASKQSANKAFLEKAYKSSCQESHISRVVAKRSTNPEVRDFASALDSAHSSMDKDLEKLASSKGVTLPNKDSDNTALMEKWSDKTIKDLDEDYVEAMVDGHEDTVELFEKAAKNTDLDPAITAYAQKALPELEKHLARAKQLDKTLN